MGVIVADFGSLSTQWRCNQAAPPVGALVRYFTAAVNKLRNIANHAGTAGIADIVVTDPVIAIEPAKNQRRCRLHHRLADAVVGIPVGEVLHFLRISTSNAGAIGTAGSTVITVVGRYDVNTLECPDSCPMVGSRIGY